MIDFVEETANIGFDNVVYLAPLNRPSQRIQTVMLAAPRTITVATVFEYGLINSA
jgi:hypothetical protein